MTTNNPEAAWCLLCEAIIQKHPEDAAVHAAVLANSERLPPYLQHWEASSVRYLSTAPSKNYKP